MDVDELLKLHAEMRTAAEEDLQQATTTVESLRDQLRTALQVIESLRFQISLALNESEDSQTSKLLLHTVRQLSIALRGDTEAHKAMADDARERLVKVMEKMVA